MREESNEVLHDGEFSQLEYFGFVRILIMPLFTLFRVFTCDQGRGWMRGVDTRRYEKCTDRNTGHSRLDVGVQQTMWLTILLSEIESCTETIIREVIELNWRYTLKDGLPVDWTQA